MSYIIYSYIYIYIHTYTIDIEIHVYIQYIYIMYFLNNKQIQILFYSNLNFFYPKQIVGFKLNNNNNIMIIMILLSLQGN